MRAKKKEQGQNEAPRGGHISRLNWLRAAVLGANDGIVSIAGLVVGVAGATNSIGVIITAGVAGIVAGAISMAAGEYVSVSSSRDSEKSILDKEKRELERNPKGEFEELVSMYKNRGVDEVTARKVAKQLTASNALGAHVDVELRIDPNELTNPWHAAIASSSSFLVGSAIPIIAIILPPQPIRIPIAFVSVIVALVITGVLSARFGEANPLRATTRVVLGGVLAMMVTFAVGKFFGVVGI